MNKLLQQGLLSALVISVTACGGGSSSKPVATIASSSAVATSSASSSSLATVASTTYTVSVDVPTSFQTAATTTLPQKLGQFFIASAYAAEVSTLTAANFAVVLVDLAGNVLERVPLADSDISKNEDGSWSLVVPGDPRLDCVIVADVTKPIVLDVTGNINQDGFVFAPTTAASVDIDVGSTAAYKNFIEELGGSGTFASLNINPQDTQQIKAVENLVNSIQTVVAEQTLTDYSNVTDALAAIKSTVSDTVKQEVLNVKNPATGTAVTLIRDEGGIYYFDASEPDDIAYGGLKGTEDEVAYEFNGTAFVQAELDPEDSQLVLSSNGWQLTSDASKVSSFNEDGTVILQDLTADGVKEKIEVTQVFDLKGRNIKEYLAGTPHTPYLVKLANPESTFAEGAKGYRVKTSSPENVYWINYQPGSEDGACPWNPSLNANNSGGNCNVVYLRGSQQQAPSPASGLNSLFSADVEPGAEGYVALDVVFKEDGGMISVQLLNDAAKTERFYLHSDMKNGSGASAAPTLIGQGTWSELTLPVLQENARAIHIQVPKEIGILSAEKRKSPDIYIVQQAGFLREMGVDEKGNHSEDAGAVFNGEAKANILAALDYTRPPTLLPTATITVDGSDSDWAEVTAYLQDPLGDQKGTASTDLTQVSIAKSGDKLAVLMKVAGDVSFPFAPDSGSSNYEVALHFYANANCLGESSGFMVVNNFTSASGQNSHTLDSYFEGNNFPSNTQETSVASGGHVLETSFFYDYLPQERGDYISLTAVVHSFIGQQSMDHDRNYDQKTCLKIR